MASTHTPWVVTVSICPLERGTSSSPLGTQLAGWLCTHTGGPVVAAVRLNSISGSASELAKSQATGVASPTDGWAGAARASAFSSLAPSVQTPPAYLVQICSRVHCLPS